METCDGILDAKLRKLEDILARYGQDAYLAVAFSGGVDSTLLMRVAENVLGPRTFGVLAVTPFIPSSEIEEARELSKQIGSKLVEIEVDALSDPYVSRNAEDRCYHCKLKIFDSILKAAKDHAISRSICGEGAERAIVVDGTNKDDESDYRPGMKALEELGVRSPLREAGLTKDEIRALSKRFDLPTWNKPAYACLATRIPTNTEVTLDKLRAIEQAEDALHNLGFPNVRVRNHGDVARIELDEADFERFMDVGMRKKAVERLKDAGFRFIALDIEGYKRGSMN